MNHDGRSWQALLLMAVLLGAALEAGASAGGDPRVAEEHDPPLARFIGTSVLTEWASLEADDPWLAVAYDQRQYLMSRTATAGYRLSVGRGSIVDGDDESRLFVVADAAVTYSYSPAKPFAATLPYIFFSMGLGYMGVEGGSASTHAGHSLGPSIRVGGGFFVSRVRVEYFTRTISQMIRTGGPMRGFAWISWSVGAKF